MGSMIETAYVAAGIIFVGTQFVYFFSNLGILSLYLTPSNMVPEREPESYPTIDVLIPAYKERKEVLEKTIQGVYQSDYPKEKLKPYLIYEDSDEVIDSYVDELDAESIVVQTDHPVWEKIHEMHGSYEEMPENKARALTYALYTHEFDDVITVLDSDTLFGPDMFKLGVVGLEEYDIVQAKQTVRNTDEGWIPLLESMGVATWCDIVYEKTTQRPYQLLGKSYFIRAEDMYELQGWNPYSITEDMYLGIEAYNHDFELGIIDRYIQDLCPATLDSWLSQKTRWVHGPYEILTASVLTVWERIKFASFTVSNQIISVVNLIGVPIGLLELALFLTGRGHAFSPVIRAVIVANVIIWLLYTFNQYRVSRKAIDFDGLGEKVKYYSISNIATQLVYATLWAVPIILAVRAAIQNRTLDFEVTPK